MPKPHLPVLKNAVMLIADLSGYTKFVRMKKISMIHGEEIITELLESVTETASFPLKLNKLEGDAVFLCADAGSEVSSAVRDVFEQARQFMTAFAEKQTELIKNGDGGCPCSACSLTGDLGLKIIIHADEIIIKSIAGQEELAGEGVILIHRLLKNSIASDDYIMLTGNTAELLNQDLMSDSETVTEQVADFGPVKVTLFPYGTRSKSERQRRPVTRLSGVMEAARFFYAHWRRRKKTVE